MTNTTSPIKPYLMVCEPCGFTTHDIKLMEHHSCDIQANGGHCEDYPCCGHELGDCNGLLYGSDEAIKSDPHLLCDHENGDCEVDYEDEPDDEDEDEAPEDFDFEYADSLMPAEVYGGHIWSSDDIPDNPNEDGYRDSDFI
jgi:hypothetical protein